MCFNGIRAGAITSLFLLTLVSCAKREGERGDTTPQPHPVQAVRVSSRPMERILTVTGSLAAREQATLSVKVSGRLKTLDVDLGSEVRQGQIIAQVDPRDYELRRQLAQAALAQARASLGLPIDNSSGIEPEKTTLVRQARAVLDEAARNHERIKNLRGAGISSESELDAAETAFTVARERYEAAFEDVRSRQATLAQRQAELDLAEQQLTDTNLRVPFDGVIQARLVNAGEFLSAGANVVSLVQINPLRLRLEIPERAAPGVRTGQLVRIAAEGDPQPHAGTINRVSPAISENNRMLAVEADIPNPGTLRPGQFVRAQILLSDDVPGLAIPSNALIRFAGLEKVIVVNDNKAMEKTVQTGRRGDDWVEILSGLQAGELIVVSPGGLRTGQPVAVTEDATAAAPGGRPGDHP